MPLMMKLCALLPVVLGVGAAAGAAPRTSLVQAGSKSKKVSLEAGGESMLTAGSMNHALAGFQKFTDDLVSQYKKTGFPMDDDTKKAIQTVIDYINGMYQRLLDWHEIDVGRAQSCGTGKHNRCVDDYLVDNEEEVKRRGGEVDQFRNETRECAKKAQKDKEERNEDCDVYDEYRSEKTLGLDMWPTPPDCVMEPTGHLEPTFINAEVSSRRETMEVCLKKMKDWLQPLYDRYAKCPSPRSGEVAGECKTRQREFEDAHCTWSEKKHSSCSSYNVCVRDVNEDCEGENGICDEIKINVDARKAENETGERIICLLDVLVNSSNASKPGDLETCKAKTYNTSEFNLACPADGETPITPIPSVFQECNTANFEARPCTTKFLMTEYRASGGGGAPSYMDDVIILCDCQACNLVEPIVEPPQYDKDDFGNFISPLTCVEEV